jgi:polyisoprenoid-binding protein YceI
MLKQPAERLWFWVEKLWSGAAWFWLEQRFSAALRTFFSASASAAGVRLSASRKASTLRIQRSVTLVTRRLVTRMIAFILLGAASTLASAQVQAATLRFVPSQTSVNFTLGDVLHTVNGTFALKSGLVHFNPTTNEISGNIVVDATSGNSGSSARDRKMDKDILESTRYSDVTFRPDRVDGKVSPQGAAELQIHGILGIHGAEHEITVPAQVEFTPDHWNLTVHFFVPYVQWGLKDPSTFILRVGKTVAIDLHASGSSPWATDH